MKQKKKSNRGGRRSNAGRKPGSPNKSSKEIKTLVHGTVDFEKLIKKFNTEAMRPGEMTRVGYLCGRTLFEYGFGKPPQQLSMSGGEENTEYMITFGKKTADQ